MTDLPYGLWRRLAPRSELDKFERAARDGDEAWDLRHPEEADRLDALIGKEVRLRRALEAFPDPDTDTGRRYPKGCRFRVRGRVRDVLLVDLSSLPVGTAAAPLMLKPEWCSVPGAGT